MVITPSTRDSVFGRCQQGFFGSSAGKSAVEFPAVTGSGAIHFDVLSDTLLKCLVKRTCINLKHQIMVRLSMSTVHGWRFGKHTGLLNCTTNVC